MIISNATVVQIGQPPIADDHVRCEVIDPEVDEGANLMVWQQINQLVFNSAHSQKVNPVNGTLSGTSAEIAGDVSAYIFAQASPKFSNGHDAAEDEHELYVVYSKRPVGGQEPDRSMAFLKYDKLANGCSAMNIAACFPGGGENYDDQPETRAIVYSTEEEQLDTEPARAIYRYRDETFPNDPINKLCWVDLKEWLPDDDGPEACFTNATVEWGRIKEIDGEQWIVTTIVDSTTKAQVVLVELDDPGNVIPVTGGTNDPARFWDKFNPITWYDPATDSYMLVLRQHNINIQHSDIAIWQRQSNGDWEHFLTFNAVNIGEDMMEQYQKKFCLSPEPFIWDERSYIAFSTSDSLQQSTANDGNIWIVRVPINQAEAIGFSRRVNDRPTGQVERRRFEAESFVLRTAQGAPITPVIYYSMWEKAPDDDDINCDYSTGDPLAPFEFHTLRRAETGLTLP